MLSAKQLGPNRVSPIGISILGGMLHNLGQLLVFATIARSFYVLNYLPILAFTGILSGLLVGLAATYLLQKVGPLRHYHQLVLAEWK
ncbi:Heptaprenyl diphosphate synthase component I [Streptococcus suis YB51]|nr:Heptaprenyl diphosphate synthase component I [Streptococcus suis YB51]